MCVRACVRGPWERPLGVRLRPRGVRWCENLGANVRLRLGAPSRYVHAPLEKVLMTFWYVMTFWYMDPGIIL